MTDYALNDRGVAHARELIDAGDFDTTTPWGEAEPDAAAQNDYLSEHSWEEYGDWHLGLVPGKNPDTKERYGFPYGDFDRVYRTALVACIDRAGQYEHEEIEQAARELLERLHAADRD